MATYDSLRTLPLHVDGYYLEPLEREVAREFTLRRTVIVLHGRGEEGRGEEVDYDPAQQARFQEHGGELPLAGEHTLESFSLLQSGQTEYRRWALESAALDLALRQAGHVARRGDRADAAAASLRRLDARGQCPPLARALSRASLQARPGHRLDRRADRDARSDRPGRDGRLQGDLPRRVRCAAGCRALPAQSSPPFPTRGSKIPRSRRRRRRSSPSIGNASRGTPGSTSGRMSRRCRSRRACSTASRPGSDR